MAFLRATLVLLLHAGLAACAADAPPLVSPRPPLPELPDTAPTGYLGLRVGTVLRIYRVHVPPAPPPGRMPLVLALHGYSDNASNFEAGAGLDALADTAGFVVAYPEGSSMPRMWNAGGPYEAWSGHMDDVGFIRDLVDTLVARYPIDRGRVYATGHSNGAYMVYRLAHELTSMLSAIAPVAGSEYSVPYLPPSARIASVHLHALDDTTVRFGGGSVGGVAVLPVVDVLERWRRWQGCAQVPDTLLNTGGGLGLRWRSPSGQGDVALYTTTTGGHMWQRATMGGLEFPDLIWSFFRSIPRREIANSQPVGMID